MRIWRKRTEEELLVVKVRREDSGDGSQGEVELWILSVKKEAKLSARHADEAQEGKEDTD